MSHFPVSRLRRLRRTPELRAMVQETHLSPADFIAPLFVVEGSDVKKEISSMPGQYNYSIDCTIDACKRIRDLQIPAVLLFGVPEAKDEQGSAAWDDNGIIQRAVRGIKEQVPELVVITDLCFCEYTSHGHCGVLKGEQLQNDATLDIIVKQTLSHARSGADIVAPSGMIDGAVKAMRRGLDSADFHDIAIMAYSAKFASAFYGPFREAADCAPSFGDRKTYQMNPANQAEALRETALDIEEGADIVMVKPAMTYLDVLQAMKKEFGLPTAAYNVSGEYSMIKAAGAKGWIDETKVMLETLLSIKRAGADLIISYFAEDFARLYQND